MADLSPFNLKDPSHIEGMDGSFRSSLADLLNAAKSDGYGVNINSGYRSEEHQARLWEDALEKYGTPDKARKWVAPPGKSRHNHGFAADLAYTNDAAKAWVHENAAKYGLHFRLGNEDWHIEPIEITERKPAMEEAPKRPSAFQERVVSGPSQESRMSSLAAMLGLERPELPPVASTASPTNPLLEKLGITVRNDDLARWGAAVAASPNFFEGLGAGQEAIDAAKAQRADDEFRRWQLENSIFESDRGHMVDILKATAPGDAIKYQRAGNMIGPDGEHLGSGRFNPYGGIEVLNLEGEWVPAPPGSREISESQGGPLSAKQFHDLEREVLDNERALRALHSYWESVGGMNTGLDGMADRISAKWKTLAGDALTKEELYSQLEKGGAQALVGMIREEVVGPGVMTEQDARRVLARIGRLHDGPLSDAFNNKEVIARAVSEVISEKQRSYELSASQYNRNAPSYGAPRFEVEDFTLQPSAMPNIPTGSTLPDFDQEEEDLIGKYIQE
ncbi:M15 family metallopeptidase [Pyruvatibacter mobilis]|uniref:M15 family metallopeptidase n=1 Tax=Pyruvatibacter mobilis TaxID=1712261 RepID=UPI003BAB3773